MSLNPKQCFCLKQRGREHSCSEYHQSRARDNHSLADNQYDSTTLTTAVKQKFYKRRHLSVNKWQQKIIYLINFQNRQITNSSFRIQTSLPGGLQHSVCSLYFVGQRVACKAVLPQTRPKNAGSSRIQASFLPLVLF